MLIAGWAQPSISGYEVGWPSVGVPPMYLGTIALRNDAGSMCGSPTNILTEMTCAVVALSLERGASYELRHTL